MEPTTLLAEPFGDRVDEGGDVVVRLSLDLGDTLGRRTTARSRIASIAARGTTPVSAHPSSAASSTSSQRASLASSDQIADMAGRE